MAPANYPTQLDEPEPADPVQKLLLEAKDRFRRAQDWENGWRQLYIEDVKFRYGDADNGWQWPDAVKQNRDINNKPCLTINRTSVIVEKLANESKKNRPEPRIKPVGEDVSYDAAQVWQELIRHIEYVSNFEAIFSTAKENQLNGGMGYWHIIHDYVDDQSFDQELKIEPLDPMHVYLDCDLSMDKVDGGDAMWAFIFKEYNRKEFRRLFPDVGLPLPARTPSLDDKDDWVRSDAVRVAEYYRIVIKEDTLIYLEDEQGQSWVGKLSDIPKFAKDMLKAYSEGKQGIDYKERPIKDRQLEWFKIIGDRIIDEDRKREGHYIPIIRLPGREKRVEARLHRAGIVRALKDPQRMYNYNSSGEVEIVALQTKTPWVVAAAAVEGNEAAWATANTQNAAYLAFRHVDDEGNPIPPPQRAEGPTAAQGFLEGLRIAAAEMELASGIQVAQQVNPSLERTPMAIEKRNETEEVVNYDFVQNEMLAIRHTAVVLMDLAPHIYDTARVIQTMAKDGTIRNVELDPDNEVAYEKIENQSPEADTIRVLFNPKIGRFAIEADVGPAYQTQREAAWNAFIEIIKARPELMEVMGDLGFRAGDFPLAQEIAERLKRNIAQNMPWLLDDAKIGPLVANLQQELANANQQVQELMVKLAESRVKAKSKEELRDIEAMGADDNRLATITEAMERLHNMGISEQELSRAFLETRHNMEHDWASLDVERSNQPSLEQGDPTTESKSKGKTGTKHTKQTKVQKMVPRGETKTAKTPS